MAKDAGGVSRLGENPFAPKSSKQKDAHSHPCIDSRGRTHDFIYEISRKSKYLTVRLRIALERLGGCPPTEELENNV